MPNRALGEGRARAERRSVRAPPHARRVRAFAGLPDGWTDLGGTSDAPRYRALGNSMAVPVMQWIGHRISIVDSLGGDAE